MSNIEILQFSEEPRLPKEGELIKMQSGAIKRANHDYAICEFPIVTRTVIEVPEGATGMHPVFYVDGSAPISGALIPLTPPKPKRCRWFRESDDVRIETTKAHSRDIVEKFWEGHWQPIPGTEE